MRPVHTSAPLLTRIRARLTRIALFCVEFRGAILADQRRRVAEDLRAAHRRQAELTLALVSLSIDLHEPDLLNMRSSRVAKAARQSPRRRPAQQLRLVSNDQEQA